MQSNIGDIVTLAPKTWPGPPLEVQPGDLSLFVPMGLGLMVPPVMRPWDKLEDAFANQSYYGYQPHSAHPFRGAPSENASGGTVYFDSVHVESDVAGLLSVLNVFMVDEYAVFLQHSENPVEERFLTQLRIVSTYALQGMFKAVVNDETRRYVEQPITIRELIWKFIEDQKSFYGTGMCPDLYGTFGGDGDWAKESLCFGLMVENADRGVYRVWSRAWLVTK